jgi:hypothetical protein
MVGYMTSVTAVTDAELEALEKQLEQQEAEEIQKIESEMKEKAEEEVKRKAEEKRKSKDEAEKKRILELEKQSQEQQMENEVQKRRLADLERLRQEEEASKKTEEEKKNKYNSLITEAEQAVINRDKKLAISKFNEALTLYPNDSEVKLGIKNAEKLMEKACYNVLGEWLDFGNRMIVKPDGTVEMTNMLLGEVTAKWKCLDSETLSFLFYDYSCGGLCPDLKAQIKNNGTCLFFDVWGCNRRPNSSGENNKTNGPDIKL